MKEVFTQSRIFFLLSLLSLFLILFDSLNFLNFPKFLVQTLTTPVQYGLYKTSKNIQNQLAFIPLARKSYLENRALQQQISELLLENAGLRKKLAQTQALVDQQNSLNSTTYNLLATKVVSLNRYLIIDKGSADGLKNGQVVVNKDSFIGQIKQTSSKLSQILLSQDPDSKIAVFAADKDGRARGIVEGQFGSDMLMDKILHQEPIAEGDLVYSEGTEGNLPRGLIIGRVSKVYERQNEIFKQAQIKPVFDISNLDVVFVIQGQ